MGGGETHGAGSREVWRGRTLTDGLGRIGRELQHSLGEIRQRLEACEKEKERCRGERGGKGGVEGHTAANLRKCKSDREARNAFVVSCYPSGRWSVCVLKCSGVIH